MSDLYKFGYTLEETIKTMRDVIDTGNHDKMFLDTYYWLKMLSEYREIGTVEECREAMKKQKPKKPTDYDGDLGYFKCPSCGCSIMADEFSDHKYCLNCGQKLEWKESNRDCRERRD